MRRPNPKVSIFFGLFLSVAAFAQPPNPSDASWTANPGFWNNLLKICTTDGYFSGDFCLPWGPVIGPGITVTVSEGEALTLTAGFSDSGATATAAKRYTHTVAVSCTTPADEQAQIYICFHDYILVHWSCECFIFWGSYDCSYTSFFETKSSSVSVECTRGPALAAEPVGPVSQVATLMSDPKPQSSMFIDLSNFLEYTSGVPPTGDPADHPSSHFDMLNEWQVCQARQSVADAKQAVVDANAIDSGTEISELVIADVDGTLHHFEFNLYSIDFECEFVGWPLTETDDSPRIGSGEACNAY